MNNLFLCFFITTFAGVSTLLGTCIVFFNNMQKKKIISYSLVFSSSIMLYISIIDLIPNSFKSINNIYELIPSLLIIFLFTILGIIFISIINSSVLHEEDNLYKVGIISMIALIIHNIPEGIITFLTSSKDIELGIKIALSITLHNIPEGISIFIPIYYSTNNKLKAFIYTAISGFSELFGALIAWVFLSKFANDLFFSFLFAITAGIMINIATKELIPEALNSYKSKKLYLIFIIGIITIFISEFLI